MWPYFLFGGLFFFAAAVGRPGKPSPMPWLAVFCVAVLFVGLRHHVGMDWNNYLRMIYAVNISRDWSSALNVSEPFYAMLLVLGNWTGGGMYVVNLISTFLVMLGVFAYARRTPEPWVALVAAMPLFMVVVSMSANRQALAAGLVMLMFSRWERMTLPVRALCILAIAGFHASALLFLAFVAIDLKLPPIVKAVGIAIFASAGVYIIQQSGYGEYYALSYDEGQANATRSSGAIYHAAMNAIPASFYFLFPQNRKIFFPTPLLRNLAFAALLTVPLVFVASTAAGRISLYWFPLSMWVWAAVPSVVTARFRRIARLLIAGAMLAVMVVWLTFANSSAAHLPYENALFIERWELEIGILP